uniref:Vacuolar protein sorting 13 homolog A n=1 Tax=Anabas testudineus TaxID=64144 RepID=A0A7N6FAN6_ANATE
MVFESVVVDVLNRFLGDYVVNLDSSQLNQLDIPFKVRAGHIGRLQLKIPWKNLYNQSVEATLDGVYLLIVPTASIKYDAEKEEKQLQEARQRELQRIEETKLKAAEQENPKLEKQDTFVEKLVTQVIKNLQVKISNIHVRYEDDVSIQFENLTYFLIVHFLYSQLVRLDSLFAYWNVNSALFSNHSPDEALVSHPLISVLYLFFRPISADAKLRMNPRSDVDFSSPKVDLMVNLSEVAIELNRPQYISILELLGSVDMMSRNLPYRKYRPVVRVHKNARIWWKYVITSILEVDVKPRLHMWSWQHIRQHRRMVKCYRELYKTKITSKKPTEQLLKQLEKAKLYTAIGYSDTAANPNLPKTVTQLSLFEVTGLANNRPSPTLLSSRKAATGAGTPLLSILFETNPLDGGANQRLHVESQPLEIIYDAVTVNSMSAFFMPPDDLQLDELTNATLMKLEQFRDRTATGLMYVIETQKVLDLKVNLMASYVIIPQTGFYNGTQNILLQSKKHLPQLSASSSHIEDIMSRAYDRFDIQLSSLQFLFSKPDGDWKMARKQKQSPLHILEPVDLKVVFSRAMVVTDSRMAKYKMSGELPLLSLRISDDKLRSVLALVESIPLPESRSAARTASSSTAKVQAGTKKMKKDMEILAKLKNIVILDCDKDALYKKAVSIADKEVFDFRMINYTDATEGDSYLDMSEVDTSVSLTVGCIQVIFLNKFVSSILAFINNFQEAKAALAEVTVQAAEKAASGVKELAERSTRISLDVHFNAPVIFLPQSSTSSNVIGADLGLLSVKNRFAKQPFKSDAKIPPVVDIMTVKLTDLKMYRSETTYTNEGFQGEIQLLKPVSLDLEIQRNLSSNWYHNIPDIEITAHLKPMSVSSVIVAWEENLLLILSQDDMIVVLRTLSENLSEKSDAVPPPAAPSVTDPSSDSGSNKGSQGSGIHLDSHNEQLKLAEFTLGTISTSIHMFSDSSMKASVRLSACLLDDKRPKIKMVTPRMVAMRPGAEQNMMVEVNYRQGRDGTTLDTVVQDVYLCASMEFLLTVADIFLKATQQGFAQVPQPKSSTGDKKNINSSVTSKESKMQVVVRNPEIVFVADLTRADAPALVMTTQCELIMKSGAEGSQMTAAIKDLKVVACPFLREKRKNNVTTVLQPCQVFFRSTQSAGSPQAMEVSINVSPIIINTVITIQSALTPTAETPEEMESPISGDLWEKRGWKELKFWFLEEEEDEDTKSLVPLIPQGESLEVSIKSICLTLEAGVGHRTVPMLAAKSSFHGDVKNWSTLINLHSELNLEVTDNDGKWWEPYGETVLRRWRVKPVKYTEASDEVDYNIPDYKTVISISSVDQLNITLSKCGLAMLSNLGTAFAEAAKQTSECFQKDEAPFVVKNRLGLPVSVLYSEMFCPISQQSTNRTVKLEDGETLEMDYSTTHSDQFSAMISLSGKDYYIQPSKLDLTQNYDISPVGHTSASVIPLIKVGRGMYSVMHRDSGVTRFLVCQIYSVEGSKYIKIRSPFQIINHFSIPFKVFEGSTCLGTALPNEEFCVPLDSYRSELCLRPVTEGEQFEVSEGFSYEDVSNQQPETHLQQTCHRCGNQDGVMMINIVPVKDAVTFKHTREAGENFDVPFVLHLWPSFLLRNLLPYPITYKLKDSGVSAAEATLDPGHSAQLHTAVINQSSLDLRLLNYLAQDWSSEYRSDFSLIYSVHVKYDLGQTVIAIHSPYWMVNKTGRLLQYKADDIHRKHPLDYDMPLLFSFKPRHFLRNNKVRLMISDSELSDEFSMDTVGSHGDVKCKGKYKDYLVGVKIDASSFSLTRIVTFVPFYMLVNRTKHTVFICEEGQNSWTEAQPEQVRAKPNIVLFNAKPLFIFQCYILFSVLQMGGIIVDVNLSEHSATIRFSEYHDGAAPFFIINHTKNQTLQFGQSEQEELEAGKAVYYTWAEPTGSRELCWKCGTYSGKLKSEEVLDSTLRVVLFTGDKHIYKMLCESEKAQLAEQEIILLLKNLGVSLVNNSSGQEVSYIGITSSDVVWELKKKNRWKTMSTKDAEILENRYKEYTESAPMDNSIVDLENGFQVSFTPSGTEMQMMQPCDAPLRRHFLPGLKVEYSVSPRQKAYRIQIHRVQIQNQLSGAIFPYVFYPVKLPKSITMDSEPKPLTDISIVTRLMEMSVFFRYFMVLIQEMDLKLDLGFLYAILDLFTPENASIVSSEQEVELFEKDIGYIKTELNHVSSADTSPVSLYEYFHISPIKVYGLKEKRDKELIPVQSLNLLLKSIGATLTDVQDVVFKLAFFELTFQFCTTQQLQWEVIRHYSKQAIKQMYVLVLGLDVLGNPFGLIRGLSEGVEAFFYEPYQGAIQGPEEFVEGMALGVKALVGGAVGGIAGAASRITGAVAKGVAAITMDEEYQQKRREAMNKQPSGLRDGLSRGGKGLVSGFVSGITGIVTKPIKGAQKEGAAGFFKGVGKGLVGAVARPTGGIIDMASSTFQGIKRCAYFYIESLRPPRFIHEDGVIRPYKEREGIGSQMLQVGQRLLYHQLSIFRAGCIVIIIIMIIFSNYFDFTLVGLIRLPLYLHTRVQTLLLCLTFY